MLAEEPVGRISTRTAGAISFRATLTMRPGEEIPSDPILGDPTPGARFYSLSRTSDTVSATLRTSCEIRALHDEQLTAALDAALRSVTAHAALAEAILETRAVRLAGPSSPPAVLVEELARQLSEYGLDARFGPSWTLAAGADVSIGVRGVEDGLEAFLRAHPAWRLLSR